MQCLESLYGQDLDSGCHGSGFPLPPFRQRLLEAHLAQQAERLASGAAASTSGKEEQVCVQQLQGLAKTSCTCWQVLLL